MIRKFAAVMLWVVLTALSGCQSQHRAKTQAVPPPPQLQIATLQSTAQLATPAISARTGYDAPLHRPKYTLVSGHSHGELLLGSDKALQALGQSEHAAFLFALRLDRNAQYWINQPDPDQPFQVRRLASTAQPVGKDYRRGSDPLYVALGYPVLPPRSQTGPVERLVTFVLEPGGRPRVKAKTADIAGEWNDCCLLDLNHDGQLEVMLPNGVQKIWDIPVWTIDPQGRFHDSQVSNVGCDQVENYAFTTWCGAWGLADFGHTGHWSVETVWPVGAEQNFTLAHCYSFDAQTSSWQPSTRRFAGHYATQTAFYRQLWPALKVFEQRTDIGLPPNPATCMAFRGQSYALSSCETPADEIDQALRQVNSFFESGPESPPQ